MCIFSDNLSRETLPGSFLDLLFKKKAGLIHPAVFENLSKIKSNVKLGANLQSFKKKKKKVFIFTVFLFAKFRFDCLEIKDFKKYLNQHSARCGS